MLAMAERIIIASSDPGWPVAYASEKARLAAACSALPITLAHIGSTSVSDVAAKPIVDIMLGLRRDADLNACIDPIVGLGYEHVPRYEQGDGWMPFRRYFKKREPGAHGSFNLHVVHSGSNFWQRQISFRDHLREDEATRRAYEQLKRELAPQFTDSNAYADAKGNFIEALLPKLGIQPEIRRIQPADAPVLRRIRLAALVDAPNAFGTTLAQAEAREDAYWADVARTQSAGDRSVAYFAEDNARPCGIVGGVGSNKDPETASLVSMWVAPTHRRRGVGRLLVDVVVEWARRAGYKQLQLWVTEANVPAKGLYAHAGFQPTDRTQPLPSNPALRERKYRLELSRSAR
jgi:GrpB-like predicted nucleotidyltransferase (UPF0157 family)/GNAT superfamily N-acetyltransferase